MSCTCARTIAYLKSIGAVHAAAMHEKPTRPWSGYDWLAHMSEEERLLFQHFPPNVVEELMRDHEMYRGEIQRFGRITSDTSRHSKIEDAWIGVLTARF